MDSRVRTFLLGSGIFFLLIFGALTVVGLSSATLNVATLVIGGASLPAGILFGRISDIKGRKTFRSGKKIN